MGQAAAGMPQCAGEGKGPVGSVWLRLSPTHHSPEGGTGRLGPGPATQGTSQPGSVRDCKPKVDYSPVIAKRRNELLLGFGQPLHLTAGFGAPRSFPSAFAGSQASFPRVSDPDRGLGCHGEAQPRSNQSTRSCCPWQVGLLIRLKARAPKGQTGGSPDLSERAAIPEVPAAAQTLLAETRELLDPGGQGKRGFPAQGVAPVLWSPKPAF